MKTTTASRDPEIFHKLQELVRDIDIAVMTTVTPDGALRSRPMLTLEFGDEGEIWFFTSDDSGKAHDLDAEHAVNLSYADPRKQRFVSVTGNATIVHDDDRAKALWSDEAKAYFPRGLDDPHLALIAVHVESAEYWEAPGWRATSLFRHDASHQADGNEAEHAKVDIRRARSSG